MAKKSKTPKRNDSKVHDSGDIVIPVMGPSGAGKSTFINAILTGEQNNPILMKVGNSLTSCTRELQPSTIASSTLLSHFKGRRVVIIDTPGFDDTYIGDRDILQRIANWLKESYDDSMILAGVIYLHDISQDRFSGTARRNLEIFNHLCGDSALRKVVIGTTKSNKIDAKKAVRYENELKDLHWKEMIHKGTKVAQFRGDYQSARNVVNLILSNIAEDTILQMQKELAIEKKNTQETKAGQQLRYTLEEILRRQREMVDITVDGGDEQKLKEVQATIEALTKQIQDLKIPFSIRIRRFFGF